MTTPSYNRNEYRKHCLEALPGEESVQVTLYSIGADRIILSVEVPVTLPRSSREIARAILRDWNPCGRQLDTDTSRIPHLRSICQFHARASEPTWTLP